MQLLLQMAKKLITAVCLVNGFIGIMGSIFIVDKTYWDPKNLVEACLKRAQRTFRRRNYENSIQIHGYFPESNDFVLLVFQFLLDFAHDANAWILYIFMTSTSIIVWLQVKAFQDYVISASKDKLCPAKTVGKYTELKEQLRTVSSIYGLALLAWVCYVVPYASLKISDISSNPDWFLLIFNFVYFSNIVAILVLGADSSTKVKICKF